MQLNTIHHIAIISSDKDAAVDFYVNKLGFRIIRSNYRPERDDWKIDLIMKDRPARVSNPEAYGLRHLAFAVESVADMVRELEQKSIACEPVRLDTYTGKPMTFFKDPDGLPIEIHE